ncbi:YdbC family protein [Mycoplasmopsis opalescens]|uniref:YdbC family protein n=1 Tax=Mycoplasmopsis opalescens TaxID=114886 RepID=UPI0004A6C2A9|nr:PC4/YdbC family ssDNA-binding protein [Mycoplasmopsis opalescens]
MAYKRPEITNTVVRELGTISESTNGYKKELNLVSWNNAGPKYDIRDWSADRSRSSKGITLTLEELKVLKSLIDEELSKLQ